MIKNNSIIDFKIMEIRRVEFFIPECMEHALSSYGMTMGVDMLKGFGGAWTFELKKIQGAQLSKVADYIEGKERLFERYEKYNGVLLKCIEVDNAKHLIAYIEENIKMGVPVLFHMDTYYSHWGFLYNKVHSRHIAVAVGIDRELEKMTIVDPDYSHEPFDIDLSLLEKASTFYLDINVDNVDKYSYEDLIDILYDKKSDYDIQFQQIEEFADIFAERFNPSVEFGEEPDIDKVLDSMLISNIRDIIKGRNLFIIFLEQITKKYPSVHRVIEHMYISIGKWNTIMNLLFKASRTRWNPELNEKIKKILVSIAEVEREAYSLLVRCRDNAGYIQNDNSLYTSDFVCMEVDLQAECNNKGFSYNDRLDKACDLTNAGEYVILREKLFDITFNKVHFNTYFQWELDNVVCRGQNIDIGSVYHVHSLELLLCAEWGTCEDSILIDFEDGESYVERIVANDISRITADNVIEIGYSKTVEGDMVNERVGITYNHIVIDREKRIIGFKLPVNPNIHIIAASLLVRQ